MLHVLVIRAVPTGRPGQDLGPHADRASGTETSALAWAAVPLMCALLIPQGGMMRSDAFTVSTGTGFL